MCVCVVLHVPPSTLVRDHVQPGRRRISRQISPASSIEVIARSIAPPPRYVQTTAAGRRAGFSCWGRVQASVNEITSSRTPGGTHAAARWPQMEAVASSQTEWSQRHVLLSLKHPWLPSQPCPFFYKSGRSSRWAATSSVAPPPSPTTTLFMHLLSPAL